MYRRFNEEDFRNYNGEFLYGRIRAYDPHAGCGYIFDETGRDVFLSSYAASKRSYEKKFLVGATLKFTVALVKGKYAAQNVEIIHPADKHAVLILPNGCRINCREIIRFGYSSWETNLRKAHISEEDLIQHGYDPEKFDSVFIRLTNDVCYAFYREDCPVIGDGHIEDPKKYLKTLEEKFLLL